MCKYCFSTFSVLLLLLLLLFYLFIYFVCGEVVNKEQELMCAPYVIVWV